MRASNARHEVWDVIDPDTKSGEKMKGRVKRIERYTNALIGGRHPRSFPHQNIVWETDKEADWTISRLRNGNNGLIEVLKKSGQGDLLEFNDGPRHDVENTDDLDESVRSDMSSHQSAAEQRAKSHRDQKLQERHKTRMLVKGAINAVSVVKYLEHRDVHGSLNQRDKEERRKAMLHMRMFGIKTEEAALLQRRKQDGILKNSLNRQFRRSDFNPMPGTCSVTANVVFSTRACPDL